MLRTILGVIIASIVIYAWGFVYWGFGPYPTMIWKHLKTGNAARMALSTHFSERGTYFVPARSKDAAAMKTAFEEGPVAMVHVIAPKGQPAPSEDLAMMGQGFVLNLVVVILVAVLLHNVAASQPTYLGRVGIVALAGMIASVLIDGGDIVWWRIPWEWKLYQAAYNVTVWILAGLILAAFIRAPATATSGSEATG
jgi:hypothetical protein